MKSSELKMYWSLVMVDVFMCMHVDEKYVVFGLGPRYNALMACFAVSSTTFPRAFSTCSFLLPSLESEIIECFAYRTTKLIAKM